MTIDVNIYLSYTYECLLITEIILYYLPLYEDTSLEDGGSPIVVVDRALIVPLAIEMLLSSMLYCKQIFPKNI